MSADNGVVPNEANTGDDTGAEVRATVLLAEDNEDNIITVVDYLMFRQFRVLTARTGAECLRIAAEEHPDIILMDIQMPEMDGLSAIGYLRKMPGLAQTPVIALTALAMAGDRERCLAAGATDYLSKPVSLRELVRMLEYHLHLGSA